MQQLKLLDYDLKAMSMEDILELLLKNNPQKSEFRHIVSLNSENLLAMKSNREFEKVVLTSYGHIIDGVGVIIAARLLNGMRLTRLSGVDVMAKLLEVASGYSLRCLLIGGKAKIAESIANCYKARFPTLKIAFTEGYKDINYPVSEENEAIKRIVSLTRPHLVFVSFGSPAQELWIEKQKSLFKGCLVMGVGGAFSMLSGALPRSPNWMRRAGLEWFFRLLIEPWRLRRQLKLVEFVSLVIKEKLKQK